MMTICKDWYAGEAQVRGSQGWLWRNQGELGTEPGRISASSSHQQGGLSPSLAFQMTAKRLVWRVWPREGAKRKVR